MSSTWNVGGSSGTVFAWDLRWQHQPILLSGVGLDEGIQAASESEVWEVQYDSFMQSSNAGTSASTRILPVMMCSEDGILAVLGQVSQQMVFGPTIKARGMILAYCGVTSPAIFEPSMGSFPFLCLSGSSLLVILAGGTGSFTLCWGTKDGPITSFLEGEETLEVLAEPCAINGFDIDPQNPSGQTARREQHRLAIQSDLLLATFGCYATFLSKIRVALGPPSYMRLQ
ncbi:hypothetical protein ACLOJK_028243 [Asimina triloba]